MTRHAAAALSRQTETGLTGHKTLGVDALGNAVKAAPSDSSTPPAPGPVWDWDVANQRKIDAVRQLTPLPDALEDIEPRIDQLVARTKDLELG